MRIIVCVLIAAALAGCAKEEEAEKAPEKMSTAQTAIEGATGKTAVDALKRARRTTEDAAARRNAEVEAAIGE